MKDYSVKIVEIPNLQESALRTMCRLYLAHYDSSNESRFRSDLEDKSEALLVYESDEIVGFTLYELYSEIWQGSPIRVVYSGDTIMHHAHWGSQALAFSWIHRVGEIQRLEVETPLYWFLIVKGHRTYRYLPIFSRSFYPHWSASAVELKPLADWLAGKKFADAYDPATGVIRFPQSRGQLKPDYAHPTERERSKEAVKFFMQRNPGYPQGEELVCLCELCEKNLKPMARRLFERA